MTVSWTGVFFKGFPKQVLDTVQIRVRVEVERAPAIFGGMLLHAWSAETMASVVFHRTVFPIAKAPNLRFCNCAISAQAGWHGRFAQWSPLHLAHLGSTRMDAVLAWMLTSCCCLSGRKKWMQSFSWVLSSCLSVCKKSMQR